MLGFSDGQIRVYKEMREYNLEGGNRRREVEGEARIIRGGGTESEMGGGSEEP